MTKYLKITCYQLIQIFTKTLYNNQIPENLQRSIPPSEKRNLSIAINRGQEELSIIKHTRSIFIGTDFERMIRNAGITTIVFTGISTEGGVGSNARDSLNRDFFRVIVSHIFGMTIRT